MAIQSILEFLGKTAGAALTVATLCFSSVVSAANISYDESSVLKYVLIEGDIESSLNIMEQAVETRSDLVPFFQLLKLDIWGVEGFTTIARDQRYIDIVKKLDFPPIEN